MLLKCIFVVLLTTGVIQAYGRGPVEVENCGSAGELVQVEVSGCDATPCDLQPGSEYTIKVTFIPSMTSNRLNYRVMANIDGHELQLVNEPISGEVEGGRTYAVSHDLPVSNEIPPGIMITVSFEIWDNNTGYRQICARATANIS